MQNLKLKHKSNAIYSETPNTPKVFDEMIMAFLYANGFDLSRGDDVLVCKQCGQVSSNLEKVSCVKVLGFRKWPNVFDVCRKWIKIIPPLAQLFGMARCTYVPNMGTLS